MRRLRLRCLHRYQRRLQRDHRGTIDAPMTILLLPLLSNAWQMPMERLVVEPGTTIPRVFCRAFGKGRVVYFPSNLDGMFWDRMFGGHMTLLANAVAWAADEPSPLTGAGLIDVAYGRQEKSLAVHLVNMTNPMALEGPLRKSIPAGSTLRAAGLLKTVRALAAST